YKGLYSIIENIDEDFLKSQFGKNSKGNLYKAEWITGRDIGEASLAYRPDGAYFKNADIKDRTFQLKTNNKPGSPSLEYKDLAQLIRTVNGVDLPGTGDAKFNTDAYRKSVEAVFDAKGFLRWSAMN